MKTIKLSIFIVSLLCTMQLKSQIKFTIKTGLNISNADFTYYNSSDKVKSLSLPTWGFGGVMDIPAKMIIIQTGLNYQNKGFSLTEEEYDGYSNDKFTINTYVNYDFVELPLTIGKKFALTNNLSLQFNFGIWVAVALSGSTSQEFLVNDKQEYQEKFTIEFGDKEELSRMDWGLNMSTALNYKGLVLGANYLPSRFNMSKDGYSTLYNRLTQIYIGYQF